MSGAVHVCLWEEDAWKALTDLGGQHFEDQVWRIREYDGRIFSSGTIGVYLNNVQP